MRALRPEKLVNTEVNIGGRGPGAADMTDWDATNLLLGIIRPAGRIVFGVWGILKDRSWTLISATTTGAVFMIQIVNSGS